MHPRTLFIAAIALALVGATLVAARPAAVRAEAGDPNIPIYGVPIGIWHDSQPNQRYGDGDDLPLGAGNTGGTGFFSAALVPGNFYTYGLNAGRFQFSSVAPVSFMLGLWRNGMPAMPLAGVDVTVWHDENRNNVFGDGRDAVLASGTTNAQGDYISDPLVVTTPIWIGLSADIGNLPNGTTSVDGLLGYIVQ